MVNLVAFDTREELSRLTGLNEDELWEAGFNLDDWDIGFQSDTKLHRNLTDEEKTERMQAYEENGFGGYAWYHDSDEKAMEECKREYAEELDEEIECDYSAPCWWLVARMFGYCAGPSYTEYDGRHYYLVHHA